MEHKCWGNLKKIETYENPFQRIPKVSIKCDPTSDVESIEPCKSDFKTKINKHTLIDGTVVTT